MYANQLENDASIVNSFFRPKKRYHECDNNEKKPNKQTNNNNKKKGGKIERESSKILKSAQLSMVYH